MLQCNIPESSIICDYTVDPKERFESRRFWPYSPFVRRITSVPRMLIKPERTAMENAMKTTQYELPYGIFGGVFGIVAESLGKSRYFPPAGPSAPEARRPAPKSPAALAPAKLRRLGQWLWRRQMNRVAPQLDRAQDVFDRLDQWMWRQQAREVESYLAKSNDLFDLERRLKALERAPVGSIL